MAPAIVDWAGAVPVSTIEIRSAAIAPRPRQWNFRLDLFLLMRLCTAVDLLGNRYLIKTSIAQTAVSAIGMAVADA